jgi:hypothetical protein
VRLVLALAVALTIAAAVASAGNSGAASACQSGGWQHLVRTDGTGFRNQGDCVSYAARGGTLMPRLPCVVGSEAFSGDAVDSQPTTFSGGTIDTAYGSPDDGTSPGVVTAQGIGFAGNALFTGFDASVFKLTFTDAVASVQLDAESNFIGAQTALNLTGFDAANNPIDAQSANQPAFTEVPSILSVDSTSNSIKYFMVATSDSAGGLYFSNITWGCN